MADTLVISLDPIATERLRRLAAASGESVEVVAGRLLADTAAEFDEAMGDDAELARRVAAWRRTREDVAAEDVHAWLVVRKTNPGAERPTLRK